MTELLSKRQSIYAEITNRIVALIEAGPGTFNAPWHLPAGMATHPVNATTHAEYRGVNILGLWVETLARGFASPYWASYRQWQGIGAQVRKGERGALVVFYKRIETTRHEAEDHDPRGELRFVARASYVFNSQQVDGFTPGPAPERAFSQVEEVEAFIAAVNANVDHGFSSARYRRATDRIEMPERAWFIDQGDQTAEQSYYAVLLHELTHWSGAPHRLNREFGKKFGDNAYAFEELVAELGAAFMCAAFGISTEPRPDHAAYVSSWLAVLKADPRALFTAAGKAQEAFEYLAHLATTHCVA